MNIPPAFPPECIFALLTNLGRHLPVLEAFLPNLGSTAPNPPTISSVKLHLDVEAMVSGVNQLVGLEQVIHTADGILVRLEAEDHSEGVLPQTTSFNTVTKLWWPPQPFLLVHPLIPALTNSETKSRSEFSEWRC